MFYTLIPLAACLAGLVLVGHVTGLVPSRPGPQLTGLAGGLLVIGIVVTTVVIAAGSSAGDRLVAPQLLGRLQAFAIAGAGWLLVTGILLLLYSRHLWPWLTTRRFGGLVLLVAVVAVAVARSSPLPTTLSRFGAHWMNEDSFTVPAITALVGSMSLSWMVVGTAVGLTLILAPASLVSFSSELILGITLAAGGAAAIAVSRHLYSLPPANEPLDEPHHVNLARGTASKRTLRA